MGKFSMFAICLTLLLVFPAFSIAATTSPKLVTVIIGFRNKPMPDLVAKHGGEVTHIYIIIPALAAKLPEASIEPLRKSEVVAYVEPDYEIHALQQTLPWGVDRIDAEIVHFTDNKGTAVKVSILDTGIDYDHPDLDENYKGGYDYVHNDLDPMDDNGNNLTFLTFSLKTVSPINDGSKVIKVHLRTR